MNEWRYLEEAREAGAYLNERIGKIPAISIITGTGLSDILSTWKSEVIIPYSDIPFFPESTVPGHSGQLKIVTKDSLTVAIFQGRFHYYEGYSVREVCFPIRALQMWGCQRILFINAVGGIREDLREGDIVSITDHIYQLPESPLRGLRNEAWGNRFPDLKAVYCEDWRSTLGAQLEKAGVRKKEGTYVCLPGPQLETIAEINYWRNGGADVVGMSTIPEVICAYQAQMRIAVLSVVTNVISKEGPVNEVSIEDVVRVANKSLGKLSESLNNWILRELA